MLYLEKNNKPFFNRGRDGQSPTRAWPVSHDPPINNTLRSSSPVKSATTSPTRSRPTTSTATVNPQPFLSSQEAHKLFLEQLCVGVEQDLGIVMDKDLRKRRVTQKVYY